MTQGPDQPGNGDASVRRRWAWVRVVLGWVQMAGAAASLVLLLRTGASAATVAVVSVTAFFMVVSVVLFRVLKVPDSGGRS